MIDIIDKEALVALVDERLSVEALAVVIINFDSDDFIGYDETVSALMGRCLYTYKPNNLDLELKNRVSHPTKPSIEEPPVL